MSAVSAFELLRNALHAAGARFAIGGSWASTAFGDPRLTNDVDILVDFTAATLDRFLAALSKTFVADPDDARSALRTGRPFNVIYIPTAVKFDLFPAHAFPLGLQELDRAVLLAGTGLSEDPTPFVTPEDILLAKLFCYRQEGEVSTMQWRDTEGIVRGRGATLDRDYLKAGAAELQVEDLLSKALGTDRAEL